MSADGGHSDDPGGRQPTTAGSFDVYALIREIEARLDETSLVNPAKALVYLEMLEGVCQTQRAKAAAAQAEASREANSRASASDGQKSGNAGEPERHKKEVLFNAGPSYEARGVRLHATDPWADCLYKMVVVSKRGEKQQSAVLYQGPAELFVLRFLDVSKGRSCHRNTLVEKAQMTFTIESPKSFVQQRLNSLRDAEYIEWDRTKASHFPPISITPKGSGYCHQLMTGKSPLISFDQHACLAEHLPWLGLKPLEGEGVV